MTIGISAAPLVLQWDQYGVPVSALPEEKGQVSSYLARGQALKTKSRKVLQDSEAWGNPS